jgi:hypothetical protein
MSLIDRLRSAMTLIPSFRQQKSLFTHSQRACYKALVRAVGPKPVVLARVSLADLVQHPGHVARYRAHWDLIRRHRVDFVVCSPNSIRPVIAIELRTPLDTRQREHGLDVVANTLASTRIRLLRLPTADEYDYAEIRQQIRRALENENRNVVGPTETGSEHVKSLNEDTAESPGGQRQDSCDIGVNWSTWSGEAIQQDADTRSAAVDESLTQSEPDVARGEEVVVRRGSAHTLPS